MKKIIISILALLATVGVVKAYTVVQGDTLSKIANNSNLSLTELIEMNPQIENPDLIYSGDEIYTGGTGESLLGGTKPFAGSTYNLAGAGISSSDTSITLTSLTIKQTGQKIADSDLSDTFYVTVEPGNNTKQEIVACTTVAQNSNGSATLSGCSRGMSPIFPYTASTTMAFTHGGGSQVIFSDPPQLYEKFTAYDNYENVTSGWLFTVTPSTTDTCTETTELCNKSYIDSSVNQGAATSTEATGGISELATQIEMASSTPWTAADPHVIQSQYASSTPSDGDNGLFVIVSENDGYINQGWLDLTEDWAFSGQLNISGNLFASSTVIFDNATTTGSMDVDNLCFDGANCVDGLDGMATSTAGTVTISDTTDVSALTATSTIPGNALGTNNILHVHMNITEFDGGGSVPVNVALKYGGQEIATASYTVGESNIESLGGFIDAYVYADNSASVQEGSINGMIMSTSSAEEHVLLFGEGTGTVDSTADQTLTVTIEFVNNAGLSNKIVVSDSYVDIKRRVLNLL